MTFTLKHPLAGFENITKMTLTQIDEFFYRLEDKDSIISFTLIDPFKLRPYEYEMPSYYSILLDADENSEILTLCAMIITTPSENSTVNFIAPFVFNMGNKQMIQALLDTSKYRDYGIAENIGNFLNYQKA